MPPRTTLILATAFQAALLLGTPATAGAQGSPLSGYMELHYNRVEPQDPILDFHRFVLVMSHGFTPRIRFVGELEVEHAVVEGLEEGGEVALEQAYLDFLLTRSFNLRAGMMLVPVGIINERHEPPVFNGVERPFVDTFIIPTTWFEAGVGAHGEIGNGLRYRVLATAPLDAAEFSAAEGIREGQQHGAEANVRNVAATGRLEYLGIAHLTIGGSFWTGDSSFSVRGVDSAVRVGEADARYHRGPLELRGEFAHVNISDADRLNVALQRQTGVSPNVASAMRGFYGEAAYRIWNAGAARDLVAFVRHENFDTQYRMPDGFVPLKLYDRHAWIVGATYFPEPDIAVKVDYVRLANESGIAKPSHGFNVGLGWWF